MKKIIFIIPITILFSMLIFNTKAYAGIISYNDVIVYQYNGFYWIGASSNINVYDNRLYIQKTRISNTTDDRYYFNTLNDAISAANNDNFYVTNSASFAISDIGLCIVLKGDIAYYSSQPDNFYDSLQDYENAINPQLTWYEEMWNTLKEELGNPAFWFGQWFIDLIDDVYGNNEEDPTGPPKPPLSTHVTIGNPTLTPAPTPIPYSTIIIPKTDPVSGDTYYETNYYYTNPSGTPIITSSPPTQPPAQNGSGNGTNYTPIGGDPYSIPQISWLSSVQIGDEDYDGIDSIGDGLSSIDEIGSEYTDGMSAVQDATGTLPVSWILLIGVAAAIPLVAGIISRFLS